MGPARPPRSRWPTPHTPRAPRPSSWPSARSRRPRAWTTRSWPSGAARSRSCRSAPRPPRATTRARRGASWARWRRWPPPSRPQGCPAASTRRRRSSTTGSPATRMRARRPRWRTWWPRSSDGRRGSGREEGVMVREEGVMVKVALYVQLEAKPGKESEVESFLKGGLAVAQEEPATIAWFALRLGPRIFGIFDAFPDEPGRQAHLSGRVAAALMAKAGDLLARPPVIEKVDVLAAKLPG